MMDVRRFNDLWYLALVLYREARGAPSKQARIAVARSIMNRVARPKWWGRTIEQVILKAWQYSSMTDPNDRQLARAWPRSSETIWIECLTIAQEAILGTLPDLFPGADSYHDTSIPEMPEAWIPKDGSRPPRFCGQIDNLKFYDVDHDWEAPIVRTP